MVVLRTFATVVASLLGLILVAIGIFAVGVRTRNPAVLRFARVMQRDHLNPGALRDAGTSASPWAIVRVPGRVSGRVYDTPVGVQRTGDDLYVSLPYGEGTQWLRNVLAARGATVLLEGNELATTEPELVPIRETPMAAADRVAVAVFGVTHALRLRVASTAAASRHREARQRGQSSRSGG